MREGRQCARATVVTGPARVYGGLGGGAEPREAGPGPGARLPSPPRACRTPGPAGGPGRGGLAAQQRGEDGGRGRVRRSGSARPQGPAVAALPGRCILEVLSAGGDLDHRGKGDTLNERAGGRSSLGERARAPAHRVLGILDTATTAPAASPGGAPSTPEPRDPPGTGFPPGGALGKQRENRGLHAAGTHVRCPSPAYATNHAGRVSPAPQHSPSQQGP